MFCEPQVAPFLEAKWSSPPLETLAAVATASRVAGVVSERISRSTVGSRMCSAGVVSALLRWLGWSRYQSNRLKTIPSSWLVNLLLQDPPGTLKPPGKPRNLTKALVQKIGPGRCRRVRRISRNPYRRRKQPMTNHNPHTTALPIHAPDQLLIKRWAALGVLMPRCSWSHRQRCSPRGARNR